MSSSTPTVLFIDQEKSLVETLFNSLREKFPCPFLHVHSRNEISAVIREHSADIIFVDVTFENRETGLRLLEKLTNLNSSLLIATIPIDDQYLTSEVIRKNPFFYINKPYDAAEVSVALRRAIEKIHHQRNAVHLSTREETFHGLIGQSSPMLGLYDLISRVSEDDYATVLIRGESGTGKELVAKAIHASSRRASKNFVPVNCAAIPDDLLESELFGHVKGAFTGATQSKQGRIQYADGGTLFLDEIGDMKPALQAKLLRVLQEKEFEPVGGLSPTPVDTRILAATHCDLEQLVKEGTFREDLYYRLSVIPLHIPPLSSRREDIPLLIESFIERFTVQRGRAPLTFTPAAMEVLLKNCWRGNVRELENLIQHMSILFSGRSVDVAELPEKYTQPENLSDDDVSHLLSSTTAGEEPAVQDLPADLSEVLDLSSGGVDFKEVVNDFETRLIIQALRATSGNKKEAARLLKLKRTTLLEKIKKKNLSPDSW